MLKGVSCLYGISLVNFTYENTEKAALDLAKNLKVRRVSRNEKRYWYRYLNGRVADPNPLRSTFWEAAQCQNSRVLELAQNGATEGRG
jgi:hypothetical protein